MPELARRNPEKVEQAWRQMRAERAAFMEFFGRDELVLPPAEAEERINAFYRYRQGAALARRPTGGRPPNIPGVDVPAFELPAEHADTIGVIYDEIDGLNFYNEYGMLRDLFADPALASDKRYADVLRGYLRAETIGPLPFRRLAVSHPHTVDAVFRKILRQPHFTRADHGEGLLRRRCQKRIHRSSQQVRPAHGFRQAAGFSFPPTTPTRGTRPPPTAIAGALTLPLVYGSCEVAAGSVQLAKDGKVIRIDGLPDRPRRAVRRG